MNQSFCFFLLAFLVGQVSAASLGQRYAEAFQLGPSEAEHMVKLVDATAARHQEFYETLELAIKSQQSGPTCVGACMRSVSLVISTYVGDLNSPNVVFSRYDILRKSGQFHPSLIIDLVAAARKRVGESGDIGVGIYELLAESRGFTGSPEQIRKQVNEAIDKGCSNPGDQHCASIWKIPGG